MSAIVTGVRMAAYAERGHDCYPTHPVAVHALMRAVRLPGVLWEPCCGDGAIVRVLRRAGHTVIAQDLVDYGCPDSRSGIDFLTETSAPPGCDTIVTNPPYMLAKEFVVKAMELVPPVIMLLRIAFIEAESRRDILDGGKFAAYYPFRNRVPMMHRLNWEGPKGSPAIGFAWYVWDRNHRGPTRTKRLGFSNCKICKEPFVAREGAITCSDACRQKQYRKRGKKTVTNNARAATISVTKIVTDNAPNPGLSVTP
jgi:hypothetical protein